MNLTLRHRQLLASAMDRALMELHQVLGTLTSRLGSPVPVPPELSSLIDEVAALKNLFQLDRDAGVTAFNPDPAAQSLLRAGLALHRRLTAERIEATQQVLTTSREIEAVAADVRELDGLLNTSPLNTALPRTLPRIADYVTIQGRQRTDPPLPLAEEETDPKHHILLSSSLIENDLAAYRKDCEDRHLPLAVLFADLDGFKDFNSALGEVYVDRYVLPPILAAVEAACFGHGRAYRHGGDEFLLLLPNVTDSLAVALAKRLAARVASVVVDRVPHQPRVSIGIWLTHPASPLTGAEIIDRAAKAKQRSKEMGKNRVTLHIETSGQPQEFTYVSEV